MGVEDKIFLGGQTYVPEKLSEAETPPWALFLIAFGAGICFCFTTLLAWGWF